ncbi:MAG TPA: hypothetical protein VG454_06920 [Gemmatimonadales bacterium]|nr:hypothetical protein [Gemmatimonadales bacterium]
MVAIDEEHYKVATGRVRAPQGRLGTEPGLLAHGKHRSQFMKLIFSVGIMLLTACGSGKSDQSRDTLTERQKDSILANSKIPNARAVGSAMRAADSTSAGIQRADSVARDTSEH